MPAQWRCFGHCNRLCYWLLLGYQLASVPLISICVFMHVYRLKLSSRFFYEHTVWQLIEQCYIRSMQEGNISGCLTLMSRLSVVTLAVRRRGLCFYHTCTLNIWIVLLKALFVQRSDSPMETVVSHFISPSILCWELFYQLRSVQYNPTSFLVECRKGD